MPHSFNQIVTTTAKAPVLSFFKFAVGAIGAVGTLSQGKANLVTSVVRNSAGNYTVNFNKPYPLNLLFVDPRVHRNAIADAYVTAEYDVGSFTAGGGSGSASMVILCTAGNTIATDPPNGSEVHVVLVHQAIKKLTD